MNNFSQHGAQMLWISLAATLNLLLDLPRLALLALIPESFGYSRTLFGTTDFSHEILKWLMVLAALVPQLRYLGRHEIPFFSSYGQLRLTAKMMISIIHLYRVLQLAGHRTVQRNIAEATALTFTEAYLLYTVFQHLSVQIVQHDERDHHTPLALPGDVVRQSLPEVVFEERKPYVLVVLLIVIIQIPLLIMLINCSRRHRGAIAGHGGNHDDGDSDGDDDYRYDDNNDGDDNCRDDSDDDNNDGDDNCRDDSDRDDNYRCDSDDDDNNRDSDNNSDDGDNGNNDIIDDLSLPELILRWIQQQKHDERSGSSLEQS